MKLKFQGFDYWDRAVYKDVKIQKLWCDVSNLGEHVPAGYKGVSAGGSVRVSAPNMEFVPLNAMTNNEIDGEPDYPIKDGITVEFMD